MKKSELFFTAVLVPIDYLAIIGAGAAAYFARLHPVFVTVRPVIFDLPFDNYLKLVSLVALIWLIVFAFAGLYSTKRRAIAVEITRVGFACSTSMAAIFAILFFSRILFESRFIAIAAWILAIIFVSVMRLVIRGLQRSLLVFGVGLHKIALIGNNSTSKTLIKQFQNHPRLGFKVVSQFETFDDNIAQKIKAHKISYGIDEIVLADPYASREMCVKLISFSDSEQLGFSYSADLFTSAIGRSVIHTFGGIPVIEVRKTPLDGWGAIYKRLFDIIGSLILIIITLPIQIVVTVALFLEQPGRILFSRLPNGEKTMRVGQNSEPFHYFKFRSMVKDAHKFRNDPDFIEKYGNMRKGTPLFKLKDDPRVTRVGKFIRKYSIDELPEFYLVLMGRMSLVGPRPHLPEEVNQYKPHQKKVLTIRPGITGMAQIGGRADLDFDDEVRLDIHYIEHWSPWFDLYILIKTPFVVIFRKGAY
ncbi:MAG: sugar transferase [Patescibacteria group bacterium]